VPGGPALHKANHVALAEGPILALTPHNVRLDSERGSTLRDEVLAAIARIRARTGAETVLRGEIVSEVLSGAADFQKQSVYKALRRMSGREVGAAVDLEDLGDGPCCDFGNNTTSDACVGSHCWESVC
jgi:hypothetical protein